MSSNCHVWHSFLIQKALREMFDEKQFIQCLVAIQKALCHPFLFPRNRQSIFATIVKVFIHLSRSFTDRADHENDVSIDCVNYTGFLPPATVVAER